MFLVYGSADKTIKIWNFQMKKQENILQGHTDKICSVAITSDNKFVVSGSENKTVRVWDLKEKRQKLVLVGHTSYISSVKIIRNNRLIVSGSRDKTARVWKLPRFYRENNSETKDNSSEFIKSSKNRLS